MQIIQIPQKGPQNENAKPNPPSKKISRNSSPPNRSQPCTLSRFTKMRAKSKNPLHLQHQSPPGNSVRQLLNQALDSEPTLDRKVKLLNRIIEDFKNQEVLGIQEREREKMICRKVQTEINGSELSAQKLLCQEQLRSAEARKIFSGQLEGKRQKLVLMQQQHTFIHPRSHLSEISISKNQNLQSYPFSFSSQMPFRVRSQQNLYKNMRLSSQNMPFRKSVNDPQKFQNVNQAEIYSFRSKDESIKSQSQPKQSKKSTLHISRQKDTASNIDRSQSLVRLSEKQIKSYPTSCQSLGNLINFKHPQRAIRKSNLYKRAFLKQKRKSPENSLNYIQSRISREKGILFDRIDRSYKEKDPSFKNKMEKQLQTKKINEFQLTELSKSNIFTKISNRIEVASCMSPKVNFSRSGDLTKTILNRFDFQKNQKHQLINSILKHRN